MSNPTDVERYAAEQLALVLDRAAVTFADAAEELRRLAVKARNGMDGQVGYAYLAGRALTHAVGTLPNMSLGLAFEYAVLADQHRTPKE